MNRRKFLIRSAAAITSAGAGCVVYAIGIEPHWLDITAHDLPIANLPPQLDGKTLAQLSDLHIGPSVSDDYIVKSFNRLAALSPDIVVYTGDFLTYKASRGERQFGQLRDVLAHAPRGALQTVGILGNHDYGIGWREPEIAAKVAAEVERAGIHLLRNESHAVNGLDIVGVDDLWSGRANPPIALARRSNDAAIVLVHNPDAADQLPWPEYSGWMLAGHTHGGQCKPPFLPPPLLPVQNRRYVSGAVTVDSRRTLFISRGVGHLLRARFNVRPEITLFTLKRA